jgi:hypothetical protein
VTASGYSSQLNFSYRGPLHPSTVIGMLYAVDGLLRSDLLPRFPLAVRGGLAASRLVLPATLLMQVFYAGEPLAGNRLGVDGQGGLEVEHAPHPRSPVDGHLIGAFRRLGFWGWTRTARRLEPGMSIHYGGSLPLRAAPQGTYETHPDGRLAGSERVFVADSSAFPALPARNLTFTIMAHAARVGALLRRRLRGPA